MKHFLLLLTSVILFVSIVSCNDGGIDNTSVVQPNEDSVIQKVFPKIEGFCVKTGLTDSSLAFGKKSPKEIIAQLKKRGYRISWKSVDSVVIYEVRFARYKIADHNWHGAEIAGKVEKNSEKSLFLALDTMRPTVNTRKCNGCGSCTTDCPQKAITLGENGKALIDPALCSGCGNCSFFCGKALSDRYMNTPYYFAVRGYNAENKPVTEIACTKRAYRLRYTNWDGQCGNCAELCHIFPPVGKGCPVNAVSVREADGFILIDPAKCINCGLCMEMCTENYGCNSIRREVVVEEKTRSCCKK